jgi:hypothetical protein
MSLDRRAHAAFGRLDIEAAQRLRIELIHAAEVLFSKRTDSLDGGQPPPRRFQCIRSSGSDSEGGDQERPAP